MRVLDGDQSLFHFFYSKSNNSPTISHSLIIDLRWEWDCFECIVAWSYPG